MHVYSCLDKPIYVFFIRRRKICLIPSFCYMYRIYFTTKDKYKNKSIATLNLFGIIIFELNHFSIEIRMTP